MSDLIQAASRDLDGPLLQLTDVTTHFNGQRTIGLDGGRTTGESYTIAHTSSELTGSQDHDRLPSLPRHPC